MPSPSEYAVLLAYGEPTSLYLAIFSRWLGGMALSSNPWRIPPRRTPTRFIASNYGTKSSLVWLYVNHGNGGYILPTVDQRLEYMRKKGQKKGRRKTGLTLCAAFEWSYTPPKNAVVASLPIILSNRWGPPGCSSMKEPTSWMNPDISTNERLWDCSWTRDGISKETVGNGERMKKKYVQLSQLITGRSLLSLGHVKFSWVSLNFFNSIVSWPLRTSLSGNT